MQPTQIVMVQNADIKLELSQHAMLGAGNQYRVKDCSALAVFLSDLQASKRINRIYELEKDFRHPGYLALMPISTSFLLGEGHLATWAKQAAGHVLSSGMIPQIEQPMPCIESMETWSAKNTALLVQSYVLSATSHDLATCVMEGMDARRVAEILCIPPDRYSIPMVVATGYDYFEQGNEQMGRTPRLDLEEVVFGDTFGAPLVLEDEEPVEDDAASA